LDRHSLPLRTIKIEDKVSAKTLINNFSTDSKTAYPTIQQDLLPSCHEILKSLKTSVFKTIIQRDSIRSTGLNFVRLHVRN
jgi:hypothetical protein